MQTLARAFSQCFSVDNNVTETMMNADNITFLEQNEYVLAHFIKV